MIDSRATRGHHQKKLQYAPPVKGATRKEFGHLQVTSPGYINGVNRPGPAVPLMSGKRLHPKTEY